MTISIAPEQEFDIRGRCSGLVSSQSGNVIVARTLGGRVFVLDRTLSELNSYVIEENLRPAAVSNDDRTIVFTRSDQFVVATIDNQTIYEESTETIYGTGFESCVFSDDGRVLWMIRHVSNNRIHLERRRITDLQIEYFAVIDEPTSGTAFDLYLHPERRVLVLWAAAGQDGQWVYWAYDDGCEIHVHEVEQLQETTPPLFHPNGGEFIVMKDSGCLYRFRFPDCKELGVLVWPEEDDDNQLGWSECYLSNTKVLVSNNSGRLFVVSLDTMELQDEIHIRGHEPRPTRELYDLDEDGICGDFQYLRVLPDNRIISVHQQLPAPSSSDRHWKETLALWGSLPVIEPMDNPDSSAPFSSQFINRSAD